MKGRKPKPLELRVLHGDAADKARATIPRPRRALPACPRYLQADARKLWRPIARELFDAGLLTAIDVDALAAYCTVKARWIDAEAKVTTLGPVVKTIAGNLIQNPYLAVANRALEQMCKLEAEFGMTPSSRTRVRAEVRPPEPARAERPAPAAIDPANDPRRVLES